MSNFLQNSRFTKRTYMVNAYPSKGIIKESGVTYDSTHIWLMVPQNNPGGTTGLGIEMLKWGDSTNFDKIKHINIASTGPVEVEVELESVLSGKNDKQKTTSIIHSLRFIQPSDDAKKKTA
jgi:hypothetical protein